MENTNIRRARIEDMPAVHNLVRELAIYEKRRERVCGFSGGL